MNFLAFNSTFSMESFLPSFQQDFNESTAPKREFFGCFNKFLMLYLTAVEPDTDARTIKTRFITDLIEYLHSVNLRNSKISTQSKVFLSHTGSKPAFSETKHNLATLLKQIRDFNNIHENEIYFRSELLEHCFGLSFKLLSDYAEFGYILTEMLLNRNWKKDQSSWIESSSFNEHEMLVVLFEIMMQTRHRKINDKTNKDFA